MAGGASRHASSVIRRLSNSAPSVPNGATARRADKSRPGKASRGGLPLGELEASAEDAAPPFHKQDSAPPHSHFCRLCFMRAHLHNNQSNNKQGCRAALARFSPFASAEMRLQRLSVAKRFDIAFLKYLPDLPNRPSPITGERRRAPRPFKSQLPYSGKSCMYQGHGGFDRFHPSAKRAQLIAGESVGATCYSSR